MPHQKEPAMSTQLIAPSRWASGSFQLAAGCVMIQVSTGKVVVVQETHNGRWFLPRGRKDVGETLEQAAFREGYEVSTLSRVYLFCEAEPPSGKWIQARVIATSSASSTAADTRGKKARKADPNNMTHRLTTTEPVYITTIPVPPRGNGEPPYNGYEYTCFWYAASLPPDAVREENTGMEDEKHYVGKLLPYEEALRVLHDPESFVVWFAYNRWLETREITGAQQSPKETAKTSTEEPELQQMV